MEVSDKIKEKVMELNNKVNSMYNYNCNDILNNFNTLIEKKEVEVGYRVACGITDKTHKSFREWIKIISLLEKNGLSINKENQTHPNKSPTMAQGFWNSIIYKIE